MLKLPQVTFIAITGRDLYDHDEVIDYMHDIGIEFGGVKIIYDRTIKNIDDWNRKVIYDLPKYVDTSHAFLFHADGHPINPSAWNDEWLTLDYIGAPWPLPKDDYSYRDEEGMIQRVGNSVSLRSKKLMELVATRPWKSYYGNTNEDGFICCHNRKWLESQGCKFATLEQAVYFSKEHEIPENKGIRAFAYHKI